MNTSFGIGIPTLNRADLLIPALQVYFRKFPETNIFVVDNGKQDIQQNALFNQRLWVHEPERPMSVAASWNKLCNVIFAMCGHALILNDDIVINGTEQEHIDFLKLSRFSFEVCPMDWCAFYIPRETFEQVGDFDEAFHPAYFEDNDYAYRMKLKGMKLSKTGFLMPDIYRSSQTDAKIPGGMRKSVLRNKKLYLEKWGGEPGFEKFKTPFNVKL